MPLPVPPDLEQALAEAPAARRRFDALSPEGKDRWIAWVRRARLGPARRRRLGRAVATLGAPPTARREEELVEEAVPPPPLVWPWLFVLLLLLLVAGLLVWLLVYRDRGGGHRNVVVEKASVPQVVGLKLPRALERVRAAGLTATTKRRTSSRPAGLVVDQDPRAGRTLAGGSVVTLVVSRGPPRVAVPKVIGLAAADAVAKLQGARLVARLVKVSAGQPAGTVVGQLPAAGSKARRGTTVELKVSRGPPATTGQTTTAQTTTAQTTTQATTTQATTAQTTTTPPPAPQTATVPRVVGQNLASALGALERAGLRATVAYQSSQTPLGRVLGQNPAAGKKLPRRSRVQVNVSEGPSPGSPTSVPDVTGEDEATARSDLESAGFKVISIQRTGTGRPTGTVVEEQPGAGRTLVAGDYVAIYVAA